MPGDWLQPLLDYFNFDHVIRLDTKELDRIYAHRNVLDLESWMPVVGTFQWPPFCDRLGHTGFLVNATRRFFRLAGKDPEYDSRPFAGGTLSGPLAEIVAAVVARFGGVIGIHAHNDSDVAVANTLAAVEAGATHVQGCVNGYGERCGNANLCSVIANLELTTLAFDWG